MFSWRAIVVTVLLLVGLRALDPYPIEVIRLKGFDWLQRLDEAQQVEDIILIDIGEQSLRDRGQWPWPREYIAQLIHDLRAAGAGVIGLAIMFPEPDRFGGDAAFVQALLDDPAVVLGQTASSRGIEGAAPHVGTAVMGGNAQDYLFNYPGVTRNLPALEEAADGAGMLSSAPEIDGVLRRLPLAVSVGGKIYPSFPLEMVRVATGEPSYQIKMDESGVAAVRIPPFEPFSTDGNGRIWLRWNKDFQKVEATGDLSVVAGKWVIIGVTAEGVSPLVPTPVGLKDAHIILATLLSALINDDGLVRPSNVNLLEIVVLSLLLLTVALLAKLPISFVLPSFIIFIGGIIGGSYYAFTEARLVDASYPVLASLIAFAHCLFNQFYREYVLRQQIKKQFEHYLDPRQVKRLQTQPELLRLGGDRRRATYLFTDVRGFTSLSEALEPPAVVEVMNRALTIQADCVKDAGGMVDKFIGDAMMGVFNAPLDQDDHENAAIDCAIEIQRRMEGLRHEMKKEGLPEVAIGVGVNTGDAVIGNMGSDSRFDYTCIGDAVNVAARLESATKEAKRDILIGEVTARSSRHELEELEPMALKGKAVPVRVFTLRMANGI
jgi:adenylate cyclase|tara:strand:- start:1242 stop:3056 length:1815 start_codon:yes stop_codon:yes gene_type:complete